MIPDSPNWTVPTSLRALFWWPAVSLLLVLIAPDAAVGSIAAAGLVLVAVGALVQAIDRRLQPATDSAELEQAEFETAA